MRIVWITCGLVSLGLGIVGAALPLLPTVPFVLLAAFCFARSSDRLHDWLLSHRTLGPPIVRWRDRGSISRNAKWLSTASFFMSVGFTAMLGVPARLLAVQAAVLACTAVFIWSRPD